jgi:hypothetical protein
MAPGQTLALNLYWQGRLAQPWKYRAVFTLFDGHGTPSGEWEVEAFPAASFRWRPAGLTIRAPYRLFLSPEALPGPYLLRVALFDPKDKALQAFSAGGEPLGTEALLGLVYVAFPGLDPRQPSVSRPGRLGEQIDLLGFDPPTPLDLKSRLFRGKLYWQASGPVAQNYVVFVHLLDSAGAVIARWEAEPLSGQYPTSRWQPGEVVVDSFDLTLPADLKPDQYRLVAGMFPAPSGPPLAVDGAGQNPSEAGILLMETQLP